ncbi:hypothetical protein BDR22DRAFT_872508 [Usnea florida]
MRGSRPAECDTLITSQGCIAVITSCIWPRDGSFECVLRTIKAIIVVNSVFPFAAAVAVALRLKARRLKAMSLNSSEYVILVALAITIVHSMVYIYCATNGGMGQHVQNLSDIEFVIFGKVTFWNQFPYIFAVSITRISILLLYQSLFPTRRFRIITNIIGLIILLWTIAFFFASLFQAWPISKNWSPDEPGTTVNEFSLYIALACTELVLDVVVLALPWPVVWRLQMDSSRKWKVSGIFALGGFVCVASAFRIFYYHTTHTSASQDFTYDSYNIFIWTIIEPCTGVVCACLPTLGPLFQGKYSMESLIGSIRSYLGIDSQIPNIESSVNHRQLSDDAIVLTSIHARHLDDLEGQNLAEEGIYVQTKLSKSETERQTSRQ